MNIAGAFGALVVLVGGWLLRRNNHRTVGPGQASHGALVGWDGATAEHAVLPPSPEWLDRLIYDA